MQCIAMSSLGRNGRFGNQIFQYAFLRLYAKQHAMHCRVPHWIGEELFGHRDEPMGETSLPLFYDQVGAATVLDRRGQPLVNADVCGYFQYHTSYYAPHKSEFRGLFRPVPAIAIPLQQAVDRLQQGGRTLIAVHVRRGDFAGGIHYAAPTEWYRQWLGANWRRWVNPLLYIASDEPARVMGHLADFHPMGAAQLGVEVRQAPYYADHFVLSHANALAISNSSFSFSAAMLNETSSQFVRPSRRLERLVAFDPWNSDPMLMEEGGDAQAAFYENVYDDVVNAVELFREDRESISRQGEVRACRREVASLWLGMSDDTLRVVYNTALARAHMLLCSPAIRELPRDDDDDRLARQCMAGLAKGLGALWSTQYLLAAMILCDPGELPMRHDLLQVPQWLLADYMQYLRGMPSAQPIVDSPIEA